MGLTQTCQSDAQDYEYDVESGKYANHLSREGVTIFEKLLMLRVQKGLQIYETEGPSIDKCHIPASEKHRMDKLVALGLHLAVNDEDWPTDSLLVTLFTKATFASPDTETNVSWTNPREAREYVINFVGEPLEFFRGEEFSPEWPEFDTNRTIDWLTFLGIGATYVRRVTESDPEVANEAVYVCDATSLFRYNVRPGFERYGAAAYFDANKCITGIYVSYLDAYFEMCPDGSGNAEWEHAKFVYKASVFTLQQFQDHLGTLHLVEGNVLCVANHEQLGPNHPLRRFLKPFVFRVISNNIRGSTSLFGEQGILDRVFGFDHETVEKCLSAGIAAYALESVQDIVTRNGMDEDLKDDVGYVMGDGIGFHEITEKFVRGYLDIFYHGDFDAVKRDGEAFGFLLALMEGLRLEVRPSYELLVRVLTILLVNATAMHELWGTFPYAVRDPRLCSSRIRRGQVVNDVQGFVQLFLTSLAVTLKQVRLMNDWTYLLVQDESFAAAKAVLDEYQKDLAEYSDKVRAVNEKRPVHCNYFNPPFLESGISV